MKLEDKNFKKCFFFQCRMILRKPSVKFKHLIPTVLPPCIKTIRFILPIVMLSKKINLKKNSCLISLKRLTKQLWKLNAFTGLEAYYSKINY